jgi:phosphopantothenoylcysteine decarboxylase/phosphopantothenate--cysteine ligase
LPNATRLLVTAGPTQEPIDDVRYLSNRSSGRLGVALAEASAKLDMSVTLLLGPTTFEPPHHSRLRIERFQTTADLQALLVQLWPEHDVLIMAAAVADFRPVRVTDDAKIRRQSQCLTLELEPTPDLLGELAAMSRPEQITIGFALEPVGRLIESARAKLERKRLDAIVANPLETMDAERITATLFLRDGSVLSPAPDLPKPAFAEWLLEQIPVVKAAMST